MNILGSLFVLKDSFPYSYLLHCSDRRRFYINKSYNGCPADIGWFVVVNMVKFITNYTQLIGNPVHLAYSNRQSENFFQGVLVYQSTPRARKKLIQLFPSINKCEFKYCIRIRFAGVTKFFYSALIRSPFSIQ